MCERDVIILVSFSYLMGLTKPQVAPQSTRIDHYRRFGVAMTQKMASPATDTPLYSYIDIRASHTTALSLSYTMHPPHVTGEVSRRPSQNTLSPSWVTLGARSAATPPRADTQLSSAHSEYPGNYTVTGWATPPPLPRRTGYRVFPYPFDV